MEKRGEIVRMKKGRKSIWGLKEDEREVRKVAGREVKVPENLRLRYTERIKNRIIKPWIDEVMGPHDEMFGREDHGITFFSEVKEHPLYADLRDHHLPSSIDPYELEDEVDKLREEIEGKEAELESEIRKYVEREEVESPHPKSFVQFYTSYTSPDRVRDPLEEWPLRFEENRVAWGAYGIGNFHMPKEKRDSFQEKLKDLILEIGERFSDEFKEIRALKSDLRKTREELKKQLMKLYSYEKLPGVCEFLEG